MTDVNVKFFETSQIWTYFTLAPALPFVYFFLTIFYGRRYISGALQPYCSQVKRKMVSLQQHFLKSACLFALKESLRGVFCLWLVDAPICCRSMTCSVLQG